MLVSKDIIKRHFKMQSSSEGCLANKGKLEPELEASPAAGAVVRGAFHFLERKTALKVTFESAFVDKLIKPLPL